MIGDRRARFGPVHRDTRPSLRPRRRRNLLHGRPPPSTRTGAPIRRHWRRVLLALLLAITIRGEHLAAFDRRGPTGDVAAHSIIPDLPGRHALPASRLARPGATPVVHHGLPNPGVVPLAAQMPGAQPADSAPAGAPTWPGASPFAPGGLPNPPTVAVSPRRAGAFGAILACGLILLQYALCRKRFVLLWAFGWLMIAPAMLLLARGYESQIVARTAIGLSQFLSICTATLFLWSADAYRQAGLVQPRRLRPLLLVALWCVAAPVVVGGNAVLMPGYLLTSVLLAGAGAMYAALLIERFMIGAGLIAFVLFGLAISNLATAVVVPRVLTAGQFVFELGIVDAILYTLGALGIHQLIFEDMTFELRATNRRLEAAREELVQAAITDSLTGCHNRRFLEQVMGRELQRHARFALPLSLLFIDVDRFKAVNDTLGHGAGDRVLQYVARFLKRHIREADYVFRWGGDEFLVLISCDGEEALRKVSALKVAFGQAPEAASLPPGIGLSVGTIEVPLGTTDLVPLVNEADARMYADKGRR